MSAEPADPAELGTLFLFDQLDRDQLRWLADRGQVRRYPADRLVTRQGEPATMLVVLLSGTVALTSRVRGGGEVEVHRTDYRGAYVGIDAFLTEQETPPYTLSMRTVTESRVFQLPITEFAQALQQWFPMAMHLVSGVANGLRSTQRRVAERERLVALGAVTAGLTHELNNPAAAAARAAAALRDRESATARTLAELAPTLPDRVRQLLDLVPEPTESAPPGSPLAVSDAEDELSDWLRERQVPDPDGLAAALVAAGRDVAWAQRVAAVAGDLLPAALTWLGYTLESRTLLAEIGEATRRISELVAAAAQYSQLDRAPQQRVDLHQLLDSTLTLLSHKIGPQVRVAREYDPQLPLLDVYAAELNQVWTNLIDNALDAMAGSGTLTVRTARTGAEVLVEIADTGPGVPVEIQGRLFEPFFTTKPVGKGTGLGLDISHRIVVDRHGGDLRVQSQPGDTRFQVRLPVAAEKAGE